MAFYVIHPAPGLSPRDRIRAARVGPRAVSTRDPYPVLLGRAGFVDIEAIDQTPGFLDVARRLLSVSRELEEGLREVQGDESFEGYQEERQELVAAIEGGILERSLFVASVRPMKR